MAKWRRIVRETILGGNFVPALDRSGCGNIKITQDYDILHTIFLEESFLVGAGSLRGLF